MWNSHLKLDPKKSVWISYDRSFFNTPVDLYICLHFYTFLHIENCTEYRGSTHIRGHRQSNTFFFYISSYLNFYKNFFAGRWSTTISTYHQRDDRNTKTNYCIVKFQTLFSFYQLNVSILYNINIRVQIKTIIHTVIFYGSKNVHCTMFVYHKAHTFGQRNVLNTYSNSSNFRNLFYYLMLKILHVITYST